MGKPQNPVPQTPTTPPADVLTERSIVYNNVQGFRIEEVTYYDPLKIKFVPATDNPAVQVAAPMGRKYFVGDKPLKVVDGGDAVQLPNGTKLALDDLPDYQPHGNDPHTLMSIPTQRGEAPVPIGSTNIIGAPESWIGKDGLVAIPGAPQGAQNQLGYAAVSDNTAVQQAARAAANEPGVIGNTPGPGATMRTFSSVTPLGTNTTSKLSLGADGRVLTSKTNPSGGVVRSPVEYGNSPVYGGEFNDAVFNDNGVNSVYIPRTALGNHATTGDISIYEGIAWEKLGVDAQGRTMYTHVLKTDGSVMHGSVENGEVLLEGTIGNGNVTPEGAAATNGNGVSRDVKPGVKIKPMSKGEKILGVAALVGMTYTAYQMFENGFNGGSAFSLALSSIGVVTKTFDLFKSMAWSAGNAGGYTALAVGAALFAGWLASKLTGKEDNEVGAKDQTNPSSNLQLQSTAGVGPAPWYEALPQNAVFYLASAAVGLAIGTGYLNLTPSASPYQPDSRVLISASEMPGAVGVFRSNVAAGQRRVPDNLLGKVFVKKGDGVSTADIAVFVTPSGRGDDQFYVNKVSLNRGGYLTSRLSPDVSNMPFWFVSGTAEAPYVSPNEYAFSAVSKQYAAAEAANGGISPESAAYAAAKGGQASHGF